MIRLIATALLTVGLWTIGSNHSVHADDAPTGAECVASHDAPRGSVAVACEQVGWSVGRYAVVGPKNNIRFLDTEQIRGCRYSDGAGQERGCLWHGLERTGGPKTGRLAGKSYLAIDGGTYARSRYVRMTHVRVHALLHHS